MDYEKQLDQMLKNYSVGQAYHSGSENDFIQMHTRAQFHLKDDGYISESSYEITIKGRIFINKGGYTAERERLKYEQGLIKKSVEWSEKLSYWTKWLAIATFSLVAVELIFHFVGK